MPKITVVIDETSRTIEATEGATLLTALQRSGLHVTAPCGGAGTCGKCRVRVEPEQSVTPMDDAEQRMLSGASGYRLACRAVPSGDVRVTVPQQALPPGERGSTAKGGAVARTIVENAVIQRMTAEFDAPSIEDQRSIHLRLLEFLPTGTEIPSAALQSATDLFSGPVELLINRGLSARRLLTVQREPGRAAYAVGFDIGTTTVAGYLLDCETGIVLSSVSEPNAQGSWGADVISRITSWAEGAPLSTAISEQLNRLTRKMCQESRRSASDVLDVCVVGNTTMTHLLLGLDPTSMSRTPFIPVTTEALVVPASDAGFEVCPAAVAYVPPGVSAYVGSDIVADIVSTGMHRGTGVSLLIDIGTNGEIVVGGESALLACSTAAGPAFEGATIMHGSGGIPGAVSHVTRRGTELEIEVIGDRDPASICGTGLLDLVTMLLSDGFIDETGKMDAKGVSTELTTFYDARYSEIDGEPAFVFATGSDGTNLAITQRDVRQLQLAKAAIAAGVRFLLERAGSSPADVQAVFLAGGFGTYVTPEAAIRVGLLPGIRPEQIIAVGNAAGAGAVRLLLDASSRREAAEIARNITYEELSGSPQFQELYVDEMLFP